MEAPIHPPSFFLGEKSLNSRCLPLKIKLLFFPIYDRYMSILHCCMLLTRPPPRPNITYSYRIIYLSSHKKPKIKYKTLSSSSFVFPVGPLPHSLSGVPAKVCGYFFIFHLFINILPHSYIMHFTALLLHWSGLFRGCKETGFGLGFVGGSGEEKKGKRKQ